MERASLWVTKWVNALNGTGVELPLLAGAVALAAEGVAVAAWRVVPLTEVLAEEDVPVDELAVDKILADELLFEVEDNWELGFTLVVFDPTFAEASADVEAEFVEAALLIEVGVSWALPEEAPPPAPAPDDDPALADATVGGAVLIDDAWI
jgi:hypothetical protein